MSEDFPSTKFDRGKIFAKTGLKLGANYAKRYLKKSVGKSESKDDTRKFHSDNAKQVFSEFTKLRGTALKIAQSLSMDQGMLPEEFADVMSQAQYSVPPINKALARSIIKKQLGDYPEKIFDSFSSDAIAAASIGQVHKATLKNGKEVAVKIQYPNVRNTIESDLSIAKTLLKRFIKKGADLDEYFDEVRKTLLEETDYIQEGEYIEHFHERFSDGKYVTPTWIKELSTQRVLTMSFIKGRHLKEFLQEDPSQDARNHFGQLLWDFFHDQVEQRNFIHADTHPGNFLFMEDGQLGVIDFGCVKKFPESFTRKYMQLLPTHLDQNEDEIRKLYTELGIIKPDPDDPKKEEEFFRFCKNYGNTFAKPYRADEFDFGDPEFKKKINSFAKQPPIMNEPRGNKNFIYSTKVHLGLYSLLMKLEATVDTRRSKEITQEVLANMEAE
ncbi:AarF/ABC1/UbiB kinase family protein [Balneolaceae bacterium YR4-1]|uniref:AarF/ABC1/UbiB kinase family protein n=1 Tax=Halalkalibaculum roseum TaxID=2709311 RepID=A0A6M1T3I3_9BACT|nr:AarF/ABC1/UbiB kinase family protein [Halalkalibaculum roseum]NGP77297.1 AarF/ABC1/UbiB kinase family protein [Halalkalibaculum roseum]